MSDSTPAFPLWRLLICITGLNSFLPVKGKIHLQVSSNAVKQDGLATFLCLVGGNNKPATVTHWLKDGLVIQTDSRISISPPPSYNKLVIRNAMPEDTGMYMCVTEKGDNATQHLIVYCQVTANSQSLVRSVIGGNATLRCGGKCYDYIIWAKRGFIVDGIEPERFHSPGNGSTLYITNVSMSDNGSFICEFISLTTVHTEVELLVIEPADEVTVSKSDSSASVGQSYEIHCQANGRPRPESVSWFNNSKALGSSSRVTTNYDSKTGIATMFISRLTRYDLSNIECRFKQELQAGQFSYINAVIPITPTGKPNPPTNLHTDVLVFSDFSVKVHLHWTPPTYSGNLHILTYRVTFWDNDQCRRSLFCTEDDYWLDGSTVSHEFELQRDANHTHSCFSIQSVNNEGLSVPSDIKCVGVTRFSLVTVPTGPEPDTPAPSEKDAKREFQFALENSEKLFELLKVSVETVTRALVALLSSLCSCTVLTTDVTVSSYTQVGGVVYYRGSIVSPQADSILTNLSHYMQADQATLHLYGSHSLVFLRNCPVRVLDGVCRISTADSSTLRCSDDDGITNSTLTYTTTVDSNAFSALCIIIVSVLGGFLLAVLLLLTVLIRRGFSRRKASLSEEGECGRSPIKGSSYRRHDDTCTDGRHSLISISRIPTSNSFSDGVTPSDTNQSTYNQKVPGKSSHQRSNSSRDSAYSEAHLSDHFSDTVEQDGQGRGVTTV